MRRSRNWLAFTILCGLLLPSAMMAQAPALDDLVAPIALYPDSLLAQVLAASTYPLEIVEAQQWLQENRSLQGPQRVEAARQQNWDPSVQALVAFPNVLMLLNRDIRWTTDLGNAFLEQQAEVMNAVQRMRSRAMANGRLASTPQQAVTENQSTIEIQPANPQIIYVPSYNPAYVWGPGAYPALGYPGVGYGLGFNPGVLIGALFSGLLSFGGWGWGLNWLAHALFLNNLFLGHFGFGAGLGAHSVWAHNPAHRQGVAYSNHMVAGRFSTGRSLASAHPYNARPYSSAPRAPAPPRSYQSYNRTAARAPSARYSAPHSSAAPYSAPRMPSHNSAPRASHMKAPRMRSPKGHSSGGHSRHK
jgi:Protein of unknown function (DUF3300)